MDWIKRNLIFVIGAVVALALLGVAGWYSYSGYSHNAAQKEQLNQQYEELKRLTNLKPNPGDGKKVDNIKLAQEQEKEVQAFLGKLTAAAAADSFAAGGNESGCQRLLCRPPADD